MGQLANEVRSEIEELLSNKFEQLKQERELTEEELEAGLTLYQMPNIPGHAEEVL